MRRDEFVEKMKALIVDYVGDTPDEVQVGIFIINHDDPDNNAIFGYGCPACIIEACQSSIEKGKIKHNDQRKNKEYVN